MGRFARDAPWIRRLFPPTGTPQTIQPSAVSDDVQLTENYMAGGQVQDPRPWFHTTILLPNPGVGSGLQILDVNSFVAADTPEVWRVFFMDVQTDGDPVTFSFNLQIQFEFDFTTSVVQIADGVTVGATVTRPVAINSTFGFTAPLLLASGAGDSCNLNIIQTSPQGAATVNLLFHFYILRNPAGVTHYL